MTIPPWFWEAARQLWSFLAVAIVVYTLGSVSKRIAEAKGWRKLRGRDLRAAAASSVPVELPEPSWYDLTLRAHNMIAGGLMGLLPIPAFDAIDGIDDRGAKLVARVLWFALAGALSGQIYEFVKFLFVEGRRKIMKFLGRPSSPPPAPAEKTKAADESDPGGEA